MHPIYNEQLRRRGRTPERLASILVLLLHLHLVGRFLRDPVHDVEQHCTLQDDHAPEVVPSASLPQAWPKRSEWYPCAAQLRVEQHKLSGPGAPGGRGRQHEQRHRRGPAGGSGGAQRACAVRAAAHSFQPAIRNELPGMRMHGPQHTVSGAVLLHCPRRGSGAACNVASSTCPNLYSAWWAEVGLSAERGGVETHTTPGSVAKKQGAPTCAERWRRCRCSPGRSSCNPPSSLSLFSLSRASCRVRSRRAQSCIRSLEGSAHASRACGVARRAEATLLLLKKEIELCKLQGEITKRVEEKISKDQRRYFLTEQLRSIKKELGLEKDDKSALVQRRAPA